MNWYEKCQTSFNGYPIARPTEVSRPESYAALKPAQITSIARGLGGSYGDAALNAQGEIVLTNRLDRFLEFDAHNGILSVESGVSLAKILKFCVKQGWFLPVMPGTAEVSLGGCIATDIHGKNHCHAGSLGQHIIGLQLITDIGTRIDCSPKVLPELFWATVGGMGLTGMIGVVTLQLKRIETAYMKVKYRVAHNLKKILEDLGQEDDEFEYSVAWLDALNKPFLHGVIMKANHANLLELPISKQKHAFLTTKYSVFKCPYGLPFSPLHPLGVKLFNKVYNYFLAKKENTFLQTYPNYFFPLDRIKNWPRLYGKKGFIQYQCVVPTQGAYCAIKDIFKVLQKHKQPIYLAVLKRFGQENLAPLSFPLPGFTLTLDFPYSDKLLTCLDRLDEIVIQAGGRVYLAKDARLKPKAFRDMYKRYPEWLTVKQYWDPQNRFSSSLSRRLNLGL